MIIDNVRSDTSLARAYQESVGELLETTFDYIRAWMAVPLMLKERVIGMLSLSHSQPSYYTPRYAALALAIANQAAVAIENARLYEQAQELAAVEERQRLARELHDSVSQALYGISLGVHAARLQLDRDPKELAESLDYVLELAEAALIFEVKQDLYRVAQEALHNTVKHARASQVELRLHQMREVVILEVCDNGKGFDATASFPGHLVFHSMQERVRKLGGELQIESAPGQGTCIHAQVPTHITM